MLGAGTMDRVTGPTINLTLDAYAGMLVGGSIEIEDSDGNDLVKSDFDPAPLIAISISGRF